jgi:hypothetical protein
VNITDGDGHSRNFPNESDDGDAYSTWYLYNFTTGSVNCTDSVVFSNNTVNTTDGYDYTYVNGSGGFPGEWHVWMNFTGNTTPLTLLENIFNAAGSHDYLLNLTGYYVWANYTGNASTGGTGVNLSIINPNPGNGTHSTNYLHEDGGGLTTSVDVTYINFTTPASLIPGTYNTNIASESRSNGACMWNTSAVYNDAWANTTGSAATGPLYVGQYEMAGDYTITRSYLIFDTSSIPDEATIDSAYITTVLFSDHSTTDFNVTVQQVKPPAPHDPLVSGDYNKGNFPPSATYGNKNITGYTDGDWFNITVNASGLSDISKTGYTNWVLRSDQDLIDNAPGVGVDEWVMFYASGGVIPEYGPHLVVNYTIPSSNWQHIVNLTFRDNTTGPWVAYNTTHVFSNGTVTVPAPNFNAVDTYYWNVSYESNNTNAGVTQVFEFETLAGGGGGAVVIQSVRSLVPILLVGGLCLIMVPLSSLMKRRRRKDPVE